MTGVAVALAVVGAVCFAVAAHLQHGAVQGAALSVAVRQPRWLAGLGLIGLGATAHAVALGLAPLVVVQPIGVLALPLVAALHARAYRVRLGGSARVAIVATGIGVAAFVAVAASATAPVPPSMSQYTRASLLAGAGVVTLAVIGALTWARRRCLAYAAAAGVAYAVVSVLVRAVGQHLTAGGALTSIPLAVPLGVAAALAVGGVLVQLGYASGPPAVVVACLTIVDPLVSVGVGIGVLGETAAATWTVPVGAVCALLAVAGTAALARHHPDAAAEARHHPDAADPAANPSDNHIPEEIPCSATRTAS
ncbi:MAG: hypothetical protein ACRDT6_17915 [Micromonosporaceae bacterium]